MADHRLVARLPELPKDKEFEEYTSACFQASGYYIERNIIERAPVEVLELDIITTDYSVRPPEVRLLEAKSGGWGFADLFKVRGWMDYLGLSQGMFIASKGKDNIDLFAEKAERLGISLVVIPSLTQSRQVLSAFMDTAAIDSLDVSMWRFSYWVERNLLRRLKDSKKTCPNMKRYKAMDDYYFAVSSGIFFTESIVQKVDELYSAFQEFPRISAKCGHEIMGDDFDGDHKTVPKSVFEDTYYDCSYTDVQISTFVEHRARLAILKNAVDYKLYRSAGLDNETDSVSELLGLSFVKLFDLLPTSFQQGLESISKDEYFHRYPVFWQWFLWVFGGFILKDYEEKEYEILSNKTGVPVDEIPNALQAYQALFPRDDGWFVDLPHSSVRVMKICPVPFMGVGANYRALLYTESGQLSALDLSGEYTLNDLIKWNNLGVSVLQG